MLQCLKSSLYCGTLLFVKWVQRQYYQYIYIKGVKYLNVFIMGPRQTDGWKISDHRINSLS